MKLENSRCKENERQSDSTVKAKQSCKPEKAERLKEGRRERKNIYRKEERLLATSIR